MPWTFAHPAAVLPLRRLAGGRLNWLALVLGSMTPDFGYYVHWFKLATLAHRWDGIFLVCLPLGWIAFLFMQKMQPRLIYLLPQLQRQALQTRRHQLPAYTLNSVALISVSLVLGALTHDVWDSFTHASGVGVMYFDVLRQSLHWGAFSIPVFHLLQHLSTLSGLAVLIYAYLQWRNSLPHIVMLEPGETDSWRYLLFAGTALSSAMLAGPLAYRLSLTANGVLVKEAFLFRLALSLTSSFALLITIAAWLIGRVAHPAKSIDADIRQD